MWALSYHRSCIRCYELYICSDLDGIVQVKNAPSKLIRAPNAPPASKRTDKNLFEASFVKLAVVDFFFPPSHLLLSPSCMKRCLIWGPGRCLIWRDSWLGCEWAVAKPPLHEVLPCGKGPDGISVNAAVCARKALDGWVGVWRGGWGGEWSRGNQAESAPSDEIHERREGEQSQPLGSLLKLMVRSNWSIRSSTSRPLMADWRCDFFSAHQS